VWAFEVTGALLITAALGAMVLAHRERLVPRPTQRELSQRRIREGAIKAPLPAPGVFARHNAVDTPALLPDGTPSELSVSRVLVARGQGQSATLTRDFTRTIDAELRSPLGIEDASGLQNSPGLHGAPGPNGAAGAEGTARAEAEDEHA
jgi:NADH-quinone oxidoreductase subunit J